LHEYPPTRERRRCTVLLPQILNSWAFTGVPADPPGDHAGMTPLHRTCDKGKLDAAALLLSAGADFCGGSYLRLIYSCIAQLQAQGPSRTCNASKGEEEKTFVGCWCCGWIRYRAAPLMCCIVVMVLWFCMCSTHHSCICRTHHNLLRSAGAKFCVWGWDSRGFFSRRFPPEIVRGAPLPRMQGVGCRVTGLGSGV